MNTVANLPIEPATPPSTDPTVAPAKADSGKQCEGDKFDSVLAEKQKPSTSAEEQPASKTQANAAQVSGKKNTGAKGDPHDAKQSDDSTSNLALAWLMAALPGQKLPVEKNAVAQNADDSIGDVLPGQPVASGGDAAAEAQFASGAVTLLRLASVGQKTFAAEAKPILDSKPVEPAQATQSPGLAGTIRTDAGLTAPGVKAEPASPGIVSADTRKDASAVEAKSTLLSGISEPQVAQAPRPRVQTGTVTPLSIEVQNAVALRVSAAVPQSGGMSIALQHPTMQNAHNQQANPETTASSSPSVTGLPTLKHFTSTTSDSDSKGNPDFQKSSDGQPVFSESATQSQSAELISTPAASPSFSSALEKTQHLQSVVNHVIEGAGQMRSDGRTNVELQVPLRDGQNLTIQLHWSNGEMQPVFKTESAELRNAIQQNWSQFTSGAGERGLKITTPVFQSPQSGMGDLNQRQSREQQQQAGTWQNENFSLPSQIKAGIPRPRAEAPKPAPTQPTQGLALYA